MPGDRFSESEVGQQLGMSRTPVREALVRSLNIPALQLALNVGVPRLLDRLRQLGLGTLDKPAAHYGLGLILGGGEVTLQDLANAYACLARGGEYLPVHFLEPTGMEPPATRIFSEEACWLISDMLSGDERAMAISGHAAATPISAHCAAPGLGERLSRRERPRLVATRQFIADSDRPGDSLCIGWGGRK